MTIDFAEQPEVLAFYSEVVGQLPQLPTTCFSRSPAVIPMWAHYASCLEGFVIEFDEAKLSKAFTDSGFGNVDYRNGPDTGLTDMLYRAYEIGKPRYVYFLRQGVFSAAYYTKARCWSYEKERRMILNKDSVRLSGEVMLLDIPPHCVTTLIAGARTSQETLAAIRRKADALGCGYFQMKIGRTSAVPYFEDRDRSAFVFGRSGLVRCADVCLSCNEPRSVEAEQCSWCRIDESHKQDAARRNPYRMFAHYGMLESYIESMNAIGRGEGKK